LAEEAQPHQDIPASAPVHAATLQTPIGVGLLGLGVVGSAVAQALRERAFAYEHLAGRPLVLRRVLLRDPHKSRTLVLPTDLITTDASLILEDPQIQIIVEVMGGEEPALEYMRAALRGGRDVVTANKEVIAKHGPELFALAREHGVEILFEASAGGGIPLIAPLQRDLLANEISSLRAIVNGTTNYILTRMTREGLDFAEALAEAQRLGYAEADPSNDVEGVDAAYKLAILASLAFRTTIHPSEIYHEGITRLSATTFATRTSWATPSSSWRWRAGSRTALFRHASILHCCGRRSRLPRSTESSMRSKSRAICSGSYCSRVEERARYRQAAQSSPTCSMSRDAAWTGPADRQDRLPCHRASSGQLPISPRDTTCGSACPIEPASSLGSAASSATITQSASPISSRRKRGRPTRPRRSSS